MAEDNETTSQETKKNSKMVDEDQIMSEGTRNNLVNGEDEENVAETGGDSNRSISVKTEVTDDTKPTKQPDHRLMISKIVNHNFKSYAGTQVLGPFHKNFSCIIGPNGSGKSNVIDSMLFVFGYKSSKIRSKKVSVLIHNSEQHPNCTSCTVEVHFQMIRDINDDEYEAIAGSEFYVSRTATKSGSSSYTISGKTATVKEVATLLKASGIDLDHNRFLILQGEVEQISLMKPKAPTEHEDGMLEYMEDIIGTSVYKVPIEELVKKVEELNDARGEKLNRVKAAEKEKDSLEGPKNEACEYIRQDNELIVKKYTLSQAFIYECTKLIEKTQGKKTEQEDILNEKNKEAKEVLDKKTALEDSMTGEKKLLAKVVKASEKAKKEFEEFEKRDLKVREDLKHNKAKMKKLLTKVGTEKKKLEELVDLPKKSNGELEELNDRLRFLDEDKIRKEKELEEIKQEIQPQIKKMNEQRDVISNDLMDIKKVVNEWQSKVNISQSEMDLLTNEKTKKEKQLDEARQSLSRVVESYKNETSKAKELLKSLPQNEEKVNSQQNALDELIREEKGLSRNLADTKNKFSEAKSALNAASTRSRLLEGLLREKNAGRLPGLCGRLGDLGTIDDKYDVAVSTACSALNNIVCDNMDTAQKALEFIKRNNLGIATFIALDKMQPHGQRATQHIDIPPNSNRLYDLIKQKEGTKYSGAFYYALRDTLVASNTDTAKKIAYGKTKRWRVVTLDGVMIDISGTMAGGGNSVIKGLMSNIECDIDPKEVDRMSSEIDKDQRRLDEIMGSKSTLEQEVRSLLKTISGDKFTKQKTEQAVKSYMKQQSSLEKEIPVLEEQLLAIVPDENKIAEIQRTINGHQVKLDEVLLQAKTKDDLIKKCDKEVKDLNNKKLKPHIDSVKNTDTDIDNVHDQITKIKVSLKGLTRNKDKLEQSISDLEREMEEAGTHSEELKKEFQTIEEQAEEIVEKDTLCQEKMKEQQAKMEGLKAELAALESDLETHERNTVDYRHAIEKYDGVIKENSSKIRHWKKDMSKQSLQNIPGEADLEPLAPLEQGALEQLDPKAINYEIAVLEESLKQKQPNMAVIKEYLIKHAAWEDKVTELNEITASRDKARDEHEDLRKKRLSEFMAGFLVITNKLKEMYQMITLGGDAELELVDTLDPFSEGIVFSVRPPKKSWKNISNLSGGEKTLSSLALVFALHHYKPSPLYVMDEIDAALDFKNVSIVAHYIKERTKNAQFIIISLRNNMFELGDRLIGIYKTENATKSVAVNPNLLAG